LPDKTFINIKIWSNFIMKIKNYLFL